jgi:hypothetical protein
MMVYRNSTCKLAQTIAATTITNIYYIVRRIAGRVDLIVTRDLTRHNRP